MEINGEKQRAFRIEPNNFLVRSIAGSTELLYEHDGPHLLEYKGVSNIRGDDGKNLRVVIKYENIKQDAI